MSRQSSRKWYDSEDKEERRVGIALNQVAVQEKLFNWLPAGTILELDERLSNENEMHFDAYDNADDADEGVNSPPTISDAMWRATAALGVAYNFDELKDRLHITVRGPNASQARKLLDAFKWQRTILMAMTWNIYFCVAGWALTFVAFCFCISQLHELWHKYERPWESMFEMIFYVFIHVGDALRSLF